MKQRYDSGTIWEKSVGYSRAIRYGNTIEVAGTTAVVDGEIVGIDDAYLQSTAIFSKIEQAITELGGSMHDVVRTRMYVVNMEDSEAVCRAHADRFLEIKPAATLVEVTKLIDEKLLVEIEATAVIDHV